MFYQGPQINVILTDDEQKGTRIDAAHEKRKLIEPTRGIKKRASELIVLLVDEPIEKQASGNIIRDLVLDLDRIEQAVLVKIGQGGVVRGLGRVLLKPGKVAPAKPKPLRPKAKPAEVEKALRPAERVKGKEIEVAVTREGKLAPQEKPPAPKGYEFLEKKPRVKIEGKEVTKRLRTPIGQAVGWIPGIGKKIAPGVKVKMTPEEYKVMRPKIISGDIPRQLLYMGGRTAKWIGRGVAKAKKLPVVGAPFAAKRALEKVPLRERVERAAIEKAKAKGVMTGVQEKRLKEIQKKFKVEREVSPEVKGLPKWMRGKRGREYMERQAIPGQKEWTAFKKKDEPAQVKAIFGSLYVKGRKANIQEAKDAVRRYRETGNMPGDLKGPLGEAFMAAQPFREPKKAPEWFKEKAPVPDSPEAVAAAERERAFMRGAKGRGRAEREAWQTKRRKRLEEEAKRALPAKPKEVMPIPGVSPGIKGAKETPAQQAARREEVARKAKEFKARKGVAVPPVTPTAPVRKPVPGAPTVPTTITELQGISKGENFHRIDVKTIRDIVNKEMGHDPKMAATTMKRFIHTRQESGAAAKRKAAVGAGLERAAGEPKAPVAPPAAEAQSKQIMEAAVRGAETSRSAVQTATNMMSGAMALPPGPERNAALLRTQKFYDEVQAVPPAGAGAKVREYLTAYPQDRQLAFQRPAGAGVAMVETGGPATQPYVAPRMEIMAGEGKEGAKARKAAEQWVKDMRKPNRVGKAFDPTNVGQFEQAKQQYGIPSKAEKAFTQVGQAPAPATTRTFATGQEAGVPSVGERAESEIRARAIAQQMGLPFTPEAPGAAPPTAGTGFQAMYRPEGAPGGPPAPAEGMAAQRQRMIDIISGKQTPELQALMQQGGVRPGGGMMEGMAGIAPWILMPSLLGAMGFEGILPQLAGYAAIPSIQGKVQSMMGRDPAAIQRVQEAYVKGLTKVPTGAGGKTKGSVKYAPVTAGPAAAGGQQMMG